MGPRLTCPQVSDSPFVVMPKDKTSLLPADSVTLNSESNSGAGLPATGVTSSVCKVMACASAGPSRDLYSPCVRASAVQISALTNCLAVSHRAMVRRRYSLVFEFSGSGSMRVQLSSNNLRTFRCAGFFSVLKTLSVRCQRVRRGYGLGRGRLAPQQSRVIRMIDCWMKG